LLVESHLDGGVFSDVEAARAAAATGERQQGQNQGKNEAERTRRHSFVDSSLAAALHDNSSH
jgi:hypothetical protein